MAFDQDEDRTRATIFERFDRSASGCEHVKDIGPPIRPPMVALARGARGHGGPVGPLGPDRDGPGRRRRDPDQRLGTHAAGPVHPQGKPALLLRVRRARRPFLDLEQDGRLPTPQRPPAGRHARGGRRPAPGQGPELQPQPKADRARGRHPDQARGEVRRGRGRPCQVEGRDGTDFRPHHGPPARPPRRCGSSRAG